MEERLAARHAEVFTPYGRVNLVPMGSIAGFKVRPGLYEVAGATAIPCGVNFTVYSVGATSCELLLFRRGEDAPYAVLPFPENYRIGKVYSMIVFDINIEDFEYAYRMDGPWDPKNGLIFDKKRVLLDIYARSVISRSHREGDNQMEVYRARVVRNDFDWGETPRPLIPMEDLIIYELHIRGFTYSPTSGVRCPGTFAGLMEKIPYLRELGVNAVELMPIFEFDEMRDCREYGGRKLVDYWGYNSVGFFAPHSRYASSCEYNREGTELKYLIRELHANGIECILDVVYNHTAEGDERGPYFSFKGMDNNIYYMLSPAGKYYNFSGCGNTMNCNHPVVQKMILDSLRYWVTAYHVDGFRFDLASILGRNWDGSPMNQPPLLQTLAFDPILGDVKLIAESWDAGGLYQGGSFPACNRWAEWTGKNLDDLRDYLKGGLHLAWEAGKRITGSRDLYDPKRRGHNASVNFLTCHDGFTMWDLYSYSEKHNWMNGWNNTDGADDNRSWNCGAEGETSDPEINALRRRMCRNAFTVLMMSRGTPMFLSGDEMLNSQFGNNNAYCQDNEISWLNWNDLKKNQEHFEFCQALIALRKAHPVIRRSSGHCSMGYGEMTVFHPEGGSQVLGVLFAGRGADGWDDLVYLCVNPYWEGQHHLLPELSGGNVWQLVVDTWTGRAGGPGAPLGRDLYLQPRSVYVLTLGTR